MDLRTLELPDVLIERYAFSVETWESGFDMIANQAPGASNSGSLSV